LLILDFRVGVGEVEVMLVLDVLKKLGSVESLLHFRLESHLVMVELSSFRNEVLQDYVTEAILNIGGETDMPKRFGTKFSETGLRTSFLGLGGSFFLIS